MKAETREWAAKADGDFFDAQRGVRARSLEWRGKLTLPKILPG
jgi:hypothetical protein